MIFKFKIAVKKDYKNKIRASRQSASTPNLNIKEQKHKQKSKKRQKYQKLFAENYFKSSKPLKVNSILAPMKVFQDYDLNIQ